MMSDLSRLYLIFVRCLLLCFVLVSLLPFSVASEPACPDSDESRVCVEYATGFSVEYHDTYKVVTVSSPWRDANESFTYLLVRNGTTPPSLGKGERVIEIPAKRFVSLSTTYLPYLPVLRVTDRLVGVADSGMINSPEVISRIREGAVRDVSGSGTGMAAGIDLEILIDLEPDIVMTYATGTPQYDAHHKLEEAGIPVVLNGEYMESTPLGRAEWIKFASLFFDQEAEANQYFEKIKRTYNEVKAAANATTYTPSVFTNNNYQGTWYIPGGKSYVAAFLEDAGAEYLWAEDQTTGSIPLDFEVVYDRAVDADYWVHTGTASTLSELLAEDARYADFKAFTSGQVYNNNGRVNEMGGNDYWESGVIHPDLILRDLVGIFHPELGNQSLIYYTQLK